MRYFVAAFAMACSFGLLASACDSGPQKMSEPDDSSTEREITVAAKQQDPADQATLSQEFKDLREATKKYRDIKKARNDGYFALSPYVPGMGFHFANGSPFGTTLNDPGVLVYYTNGSYNPDPGDPHDPARDDDLILGAVEYLVEGNQTSSPPNIFADETSPRHLKVTEEEGWHYESSEGFTGLHAWIYRGNPAGVFHPTNPTVD